MNICYKTTTFLPSEGAISDCFQPFPLGHLWDLQKKTVLRGARKCLFLKEMRVGQVLAWSYCRPFPTVSDRFRPFHFFWTISWTKSIYGRLIQCKPVQTMTLKFVHVFSCDPCARTLHQILHLDLDIQYSLKITKSQELVKFNNPQMAQIFPHAT